MNKADTWIKESKGILLDLDHTLYDYDRCHEESINLVLASLSKKFSISISEMEEVFNRARKKIHRELVNTASSHNRMLYFQKMFEELKLDSLRYTLETYNLYWDTFLSLLNYDKGVEEILQEIKSRKKVCLVTDLTVHIQHRKVQKLQLYKYLDYMVSSEEAGAEKPDPRIFNLSLTKLGMTAFDVCMIGDDYKKDISGALNLNIRSFWLNRNHEESKEHDLVMEIKTFIDLEKYV